MIFSPFLSVLRRYQTMHGWVEGAVWEGRLTWLRWGSDQPTHRPCPPTGYTPSSRQLMGGSCRHSWRRKTSCSGWTW